MMEMKLTPKGIKVCGKLYTKPSQLVELFKSSPKSQNRKVRKALYADGKRALAAVR
jgi:hypothetical protein